MVCHRNDFNEVGPLKVNDAKRKLVKEESPVSPVHSGPTPWRIGYAVNRCIELGEKGIRGRRAARRIPSTCPLSLVCG